MSSRMKLSRRAAFALGSILALSAASLPTAALAAEGMPQLDFANPLTVSQIVWGALIFLVLFVTFSTWGLPRVGSVLAEREARISGDLEAARDAKANADAAVEELNATIAKAKSEAQSAINAAVAQAKAEAAARTQTLNERLEQQLQAAEQQIAAARAAAMGALREVATETASLVVGRLTGTTPANDVIENAVGAALAARGQG